jgi:hypothetical protein
MPFSYCYLRPISLTCTRLVVVFFFMGTARKGMAQFSSSSGIWDDVPATASSGLWSNPLSQPLDLTTVSSTPHHIDANGNPVLLDTEGNPVLDSLGEPVLDSAFMESRMMSFGANVNSFGPPPPPDDPVDVPIDGGVGILIMIGVGIGYKNRKSSFGKPGSKQLNEHSEHRKVIIGPK